MRHEIGNLKPVTPRASNMHKICSFDQPIKRIIKSLNLPNAFLFFKGRSIGISVSFVINMICQDYLHKTMPQIICNAALTNKTNANKFDVPSSAVLV